MAPFTYRVEHWNPNEWRTPDFQWQVVDISRFLASSCFRVVAPKRLVCRKLILAGWDCGLHDVLGRPSGTHGLPIPRGLLSLAEPQVELGDLCQNL